MLKDILIIGHNHFDPVWRRCFDRRAVYNGVTVRSYTEVEDLVTSRWLELAKFGYTWSEGQAAVWRKYLERHPDSLRQLREEIVAGRLAVMFAGETVQDSNLPSAEGLVRNFLVAMPLYRDLCGDEHLGLRIGWQEDAFGNSPNYPQILKGVGIEVACFTSYRSCPDEVWIGIDGSRICCLDRVPKAMAWHFVKHPPCSECGGKGCAVCHDTGIHIYPHLTQVNVNDVLESVIAKELAKGETAPEATTYVIVGGEETLPEACVLDVLADLNRKYAGKVMLRFGTMVDLYGRIRSALAEKEAHEDKHTPHDLNPAMPGCYVTRIRMKQRTREVAYILTAAEAFLANAAWADGRPIPQPETLSQAWRKVAFCQFHDAVTGTSIDSVHAELMELLDEAEQLARGHLPAKAAPPPVSEVFTPVNGVNTRCLGKLKVCFDRRGIIKVDCNGQDLFAPFAHAITLEPFRIGELTLESDYGDAWGQRIEPLCGAQHNLQLRPLGEFNDCVEVSDNAIRWHGCYRGGHRKVRHLAWSVTVRASDDGRRLDFETEVEWDTESKRLRVVFPVANREDTATYEVPFGFIDRRFDAGAMRYGLWDANAMEFPILHWARKSIDSHHGIALLTRGIPCVRWMPGCFDLSLLRSPESEFGNVESAHYEFWDTDGQRDSGKHHFEYSIWPYTEALSTTELTRAGYAFNRPDFPTLPFEIHGDVVVTAWKPAEDGTGWILRLQDTTGNGTTVRLRFAEPRKVVMTDLLEKPLTMNCKQSAATAERETAGVVYEAVVHQHGILTLKIR